MENQGARNFFRSIWDSLTSPNPAITEQTKQWQARLTTITVLVIFTGISLNVLIDGGLQPLLLLPIFLSYLLSRTKYFRIASFVILGTLLSAVLHSVLIDNDFHKYTIFSNIAWLSLSLLLTSLLFSILETTFIALAHIAILVLMVWFVPEMDFRSVGVTMGFLFMFSALLIATMWQRNWLESVRQQEIRMQATALESSDYAVMILNNQREVIWVNPAFIKLTGFTQEDTFPHELPFINDPQPDQRLSDQIWTTLYQGQTWQGVVDNYKKSGQQYDESMIITPVTTEKGDISHFVAIKHDITEQIAGEERLKFLATHDLLTSLPNRGLLHDRLSRAIARANRTQQIGAVLYLDLDNFKHINDAYSHEEGDHVLRILAQRMQALTREADTVARISGDEFVILMEDVEDTKNVSLLTERILYEISKPIQLQQSQAIITASIGISLFPVDGQDNDSLLQNADVAMYYGKSKGKNSYVFFTEAMKKDTLKRVSLGSDLQNALSQSEFMLEYQPQIDLHSNQIIGAEALIRWQHPEHGKIYPNDFIPLAEENNLMLPIGEWVFKQALDLFQLERHPQLNDLQLSINLSGCQLRDHLHFETIAALIDSANIDPTQIQLEISEASILEYVEKTSYDLKRFKSLGVKLAIDDFDTGHSSLNYLEMYPIDTIKIDISSIKRITHKEIDLPILNGIISIAHDMGLEVIAEGVEAQAQLDYLQCHGCHLAQGFYFHKPMPPSDLIQAIESN